MLSDRDLLGRLVGIDSTSANSNLPIADVVCDYLDRPGVDITRLPNDDGTKVNVLARIGPEPEHGEGLTLSGHLDVVPATEPEWTSDPFTLTERGDAWYGRGSCDMKGFVAVAMNVFAAIDPSGWPTPLWLILTYDEELGTLGAQQFAASWPARRPLPRSAIIGEPTSLRVVRLHKGHLTMRVTVEGRSAHSGSPHLGRNAIEPAGRIVAALAEVARELAEDRVASSAYFAAVPYPVLNVARIHGGDAINVVPEQCTIDLGLRLLPGHDSGRFVDLVRRRIDEAAGDTPVTVAVLNESPPLDLPDDAPIHRSMCDLMTQDQSFGVSFASDAGPFQRLGMECVLWGPGTIEVAHRPDEHVPVAEMVRCRELLEEVVRG